jgi:hypothetical protein
MPSAVEAAGGDRDLVSDTCRFQMIGEANRERDDPAATRSTDKRIWIYMIV